MAGIDKAAIVFSIAIALVGVGIAVAGNSIDNAPSVSTPTVSPEPMMDKNMGDAMDENMDAMDENMDAMDENMDAMDENMDAMDENMDAMDENMDAMDENMDAMDENMDAMDVPAGPTTHTVDIPLGTSVPGCEVDNACYTPADITINAGDTVEWINVDTAAHTVTSGSSSEGPSGIFDSSLVMADANYAFTFDEAGNYDYFCIVHPWMVGSITVN